MKKLIENPALLARECIEGKILSAVISAPRNSDPREQAELFDKIRIRPVQLKTGSCYQLEQFRGTKVFHKNVNSSELETLIENWLENDYSRAEFSTEKGSIQVLANRRGELTALRKNAPSKVNLSEPGPHSHNRTKQYILQEGIPVPFLIDLGVMAKDGSVIKAMYDKFRQINRFLEFIADVVPELRLAAAENDAAEGAENTQRTITIVDFGCGKSYLTFAVYYYLSVLQKLPVRIIGLDLKEDVITRCSSLALAYGYSGLHFAVGDIADYKLTDTADMVISLHACDTATDFALARAVRWKARVILAVPCCQHEMNAQLSDKTEGAAPGRTVLKPALKYGIVRERLAALFTDVLRAELLEAEGYQVQILEFIDMTHTPKNLLIRAVRIDRAVRNSDYTGLRDFLGVKPALEKELR